MKTSIAVLAKKKTEEKKPEPQAAPAPVVDADPALSEPIVVIDDSADAKDASGASPDAPV